MDTQIEPRPPGHVHAYVIAEDVPTTACFCDECGQRAKDPLACMECPRVTCAAHLEDTRTASERCRDHGPNGECGWCCAGVP